MMAPDRSGILTAREFRALQRVFYACQALVVAHRVACPVCGGNFLNCPGARQAFNRMMRISMVEFAVAMQTQDAERGDLP